MTSAGWLFMLTSLGLVWSLAGWCYLKIFQNRALTPKASSQREPPTG